MRRMISIIGILVVMNIIAAIEYQAYSVTTPPVIDGNFNDVCWEKAQVASKFTKHKGGAANPDTEFRIVYDNNNFYLAIKCYEPNPAGMICEATKHDEGASIEGKPVYEDNNVEIDIDTMNWQTGHFQLTINSKGITADSSFVKSDGDFGLWEANAELAIVVGSNYWSVEVKIPLSSLEGGKMNYPKLDLPIAKDTVWGFNIGRVRRSSGEELSTWSPEAATVDNGSIDFNNEAAYGKIVFKGPAVPIYNKGWGIIKTLFTK